MSWTALATRATGDLITASIWNANTGNLNLLWRELSRTEITGDVTVSATSAAAADLVVSSGAVTYEAKPIRISFSSANVATGATAESVVFIHLWDDGTDLGRIATIGKANGSQTFQVPVRTLPYRLTPTAASHTYKVMAWRAASNGTVGAASPLLPASLLIEAAES